MKKYFLFASAIVAFASCTSDTFTGTDDEARQAQGEKAITFGFDVPAATRATGQEAATKLGNQFIVYGEKSENADGYKYDDSENPSDATNDVHQLVFQNYVVKYVNGSDYTTTSNTKGWEYVGYTQTYGNNVTPKADETQTIKYWDYSASNYVFTAFSALESDLSSGNVQVTKVQVKTDGNKVFDKGYTVTLGAGASLSNLYFSDRQVIAQGTGADRTATNAYGGNVTFTFRSGMSQVRAAMYEDIPGYQVVIDKFYYVNAANPGFDAMTTAGTDKFYANVPNLATGAATTLNVTYYSSGDRVNQPKITASGTTANFIALGTNLKATTELGESISDAVYDKSDKSYTLVFPQEANDKNLKLKVDYTLTNAKTNETIKVTGSTAEVPATYLQWKANFSYTYIFKISDNTNGVTNPSAGPAGLYPITFDAAVVVAEDGQAEYITTVSEPSITTFGVKSSKYTHDKAEYEAGSDIYATFMEGSTVQTPALGSGAQHVNVYAVATTNATSFPITEASVAESVAEGYSITGTIYTYDSGTSTYTAVAAATDLERGTTYYKSDGTKNPGEDGYDPTAAVAGTDYKIPEVTFKNINADASTYFTAVPAVVSTVPSEDGLTITIDALKLTGIKVGTYAIEYEASSAWTGQYKKVYKVIKVVAP